MKTNIDTSKPVKINKHVINRRFPEFISETIKVLRGKFKRIKLDKCGNWFRSGKGVRILKKNGSIKLGYKVQLHRHVKLSAWGTEGFAEIIIGDNSYIGDRTEIHAGKRVKIGSGCNIAWDVCIMDRDYHKFNSYEEEIKPVVIKDNVWIGCRSIILKGVTIGQGAVIAAGSIVTTDVAPKTLVGGNPAGTLKEDIYWTP